MMRILTSLIAALMLSGCGKTSGFASQDLEPVFITVRQAGPASVEGNLADDIDLEKLVAALPSSGVTEIRVRCTRDDSVRLRQVSDTLEVPLYVNIQQSEVPILTLIQEGLSWCPGYSWRLGGSGNCTLEGVVIITNSTNQVWNASMVRIEDTSGSAVASTATALTIPEGDLVVRWWEATGTTGMLSLTYGWPITGRWNTLLPLVVPTAGPVLSEGTGADLLTRNGSDTVWVSVPGVIEVEEQSNQVRAGYLCSMTLTNLTTEELELVLIYPEILPRGAFFRPGEGFETWISIAPRGTRSMYYSIVYSAL
jgi:hypothetical protein